MLIAFIHGYPAARQVDSQYSSPITIRHGSPPVRTDLGYLRFVLVRDIMSGAIEHRYLNTLLEKLYAGRPAWAQTRMSSLTSRS